MTAGFAGLASLMLLSACQTAAPAQTALNNKTVTPQAQTSAEATPLTANDCSKVTPVELAVILGNDAVTGKPVTTDQLMPQPVTEGPDKGSWICSYGESLKTTFTVYPLANEAAAKAYYDDYLQTQEDLSGKLDESQYPNGSYSEIVNTNNGWEGIRSEVTGSLMSRKGNVMLFIPSMPADKMMQVKITDAFFSKLK